MSRPRLSPPTEAEWLASVEPCHLMNSIAGRGRARRLRLCAVACCRRIARLMPDDRCRQALDVAEAYADRRVTKEQLALAHAENDEVIVWHEELTTCGIAATLHAAGAVRFATDTTTNWSAYPALIQAAAANGYSQFPAETPYRPNDPGVAQAMGDEQRAQAALIRDLVRNPFRPPSLNRASFPASVLSVAQAAYDERPPSCELDPLRLSVLADALVDGGCADDAILSHLRSPGPHVRGCWVVDLILSHCS